MIRRLWGRLGLRARITGLYALGGLLYSLLTRLPPARGHSLHEVLARVLSGSVEVRELPDGSSRIGAALVERPSSALFRALSPMEMREQLE